MSTPDAASINFFKPDDDRHQSVLKAVDAFQENAGSIASKISIVGQDQIRDEEIDEAEELNPNKVNTADLIMATSFNDFATPANFALAHRANIRNADKYGDHSISDGGGTIMEVNGIVYVNGKAVDGDEEENDDALESFKDQVDEFNERQFEKRHDVTQSYQEWSETDQAFGNVHMNGKDWERIQSWLQNKDNRKKAEDRLKQEGYTADQINKIFRVNEIMAKPPSQWTPEETEFIRRQERDPEISRGVDVVATSARGNGVQLSNENVTSLVADKGTSTVVGRSILAENSTSLEGSQNTELLATDDRSVTSIARVSDNANLFSNAPEIRPAFEVASNNTLSTAETPTPVPARSIAPVIADAGFG